MGEIHLSTLDHAIARETFGQDFITLSSLFYKDLTVDREKTAYIPHSRV
jgi:hypothetical protein